MTKKKQEAVEPVAPVTEQPLVDYYAEFDVRLAVLGDILSLISHAPSLLAEGSVKSAENLVAQCRDLLVKMKEHTHGE